MKKLIILVLSLIVGVFAVCSIPKKYHVTETWGCQVNNNVLNCEPNIHIDSPDGTHVMVYKHKKGTIICPIDASNPFKYCMHENQKPLNGVMVWGNNNRASVKSWYKNGKKVQEQQFDTNGTMWLEMDYIHGKKSEMIDGQMVVSPIEHE